MMAARAVYKAMEETEIEFGYVNYKETCKYISSNWSEAQVACSNIRRVLPRRAKNGGSRPMPICWPLGSTKKWSGNLYQI